MDVNELLEMLRTKGLDDEAIKNLLDEALATLNPDEEEFELGEEGLEEKDKASELLGVEL